MRRLSILVPLYNEEEYIGPLLDRVLAAPLPESLDREVIVVDDGSSDDSAEIASQYEAQYPGVVRVIRHGSNRGKGAAIRTAVEAAAGEFCVIQDADLEYDPRDYGKLLKPLLEDDADAVYGSRFAFAGERRVLYFWHSFANRVLTTLCNLVSDLNLTDMETCYKAFRTELIRSIPIRSDRFGIEPEITIKLARRQARIYETSISYHGRTYQEGKKIGLKDAVETLWVILRFWLSSDIYKHAGGGILEALSDAPRFNRWMADTIRPFVGRDVMEIGAGIGNLSSQLISGRRRYVATDIDEHHLARLRARFQNRPRVTACMGDLQSAEDFQPYADQMDTVVCLNVLEHVKDDPQGLRNMFSVLKPGGSAIVLVPQDPRIYGTLDAALYHYRRYEKQELRDKMEAAGFAVEQVLSFNRISRPGWYVTGKLLKRSTLSRTQMKIFDRFVWLWRLIDRYLPWPATSIIAIGRRPGAGE